MPKAKSTGAAKGFAFIEYENSSSTDLAFRALNGIEHEKLGSILVSFANPAKHFEPQPSNTQPPRQQSNNQKQTTPQNQTQKTDSVNKNRANAGRGGRFPPGRGSFAGRQGPMAGRGMAPGRGFPLVGRGMMPPAVPMMPAIIDPAVIAMQQQQQLQLQAQMRIMQQTFRNETLMMQQDLQRRQAIREQELQQELEKTRRALQAQQQQAQQQLKMAETKVKQEAEARRRAEEQAKKAAAAQAALAMQAQSANLGNMGSDYNNMRGLNKGMNKGGMGASNYGMTSQKSMNEFASNNGSSSVPYGSGAFGQTNEHNMYGSATYGSANGNVPYTQNMGGGQDAPLGMQAYHQMTGRVAQSGYNTGSDSRYGGPATGMGSIATGGAGAIGGGDTSVYSGQAAGYAMAQGMNYNSAGYGGQGLDGMYGGGQANTPLAGSKRDADMTGYGQAGFAMDNTGFGLPGMRSDYKRPRY